MSALLPLATVIVMELERRRGTAKDRDLYEAVKQILSSFNSDISFSQFNKALMALELQGVIRVEPLRKNVRMVYLVAGGSQKGAR